MLIDRTSCLSTIPGYGDVAELEQAFVPIDAGTFEAGAARFMTHAVVRTGTKSSAPVPAPNSRPPRCKNPTA